MIYNSVPCIVISFLYPLSLRIFVKKNQVILNEFVEYNSLNKFSKYKFYIIKDFKTGLLNANFLIPSIVLFSHILNIFN